ncbi:hypothetical protein BKA69DRAFT_19269 [Paraphysoderma sedebokerense]|nr:hypothetical protein BKA69DRAFT_19269 [Paraphysoderma sedebokerense]
MKFLQVIFVFAIVCNMFTFQNAAPTTLPATTETKAAETVPEATVPKSIPEASTSRRQDIEKSVTHIVDGAVEAGAGLAGGIQALIDNKSVKAEERQNHLAKAISGIVSSVVNAGTKIATEAISLDEIRRQRQETQKKETQ